MMITFRKQQQQSQAFNGNKHLTASFPDNLGKSVPERQNHSGFNEARDDGWQWHQLDHMQIICTSPQTDSIFTGRMLFMMPNQQCQSSEGRKMLYN